MYKYHLPPFSLQPNPINTNKLIIQSLVLYTLMQLPIQLLSRALWYVCTSLSRTDNTRVLCVYAQHVNIYPYSAYLTATTNPHTPGSVVTNRMKNKWFALALVMEPMRQSGTTVSVYDVHPTAEKYRHVPSSETASSIANCRQLACTKTGRTAVERDNWWNSCTQTYHLLCAYNSIGSHIPCANLPLMKHQRFALAVGQHSVSGRTLRTVVQCGVVLLLCIFCPVCERFKHGILFCVRFEILNINCIYTRTLIRIIKCSNK